jgi:hypothetical protein
VRPEAGEEPLLEVMARERPGRREREKERAPVSWLKMRWWLMPIILASWEAKIGNITVLGQPGQKKFARPHLNRKKWA